MFSKKNILKHTKILLTFLVFHFVWITFIKFQIGYDLEIEFLKSNLLNAWKDLYLIFIYFLIFVYALKNKDKIQINKKLLLGFLFMLIISIWISLMHFNWLKSLILWFKYDIRFLFPLVFFSILRIEEKEAKEFFNLFIDLIKVVLVLSILFDLVRFLYPNFLYLLWYGPIWDWATNTHPPLLFQTWLDWAQRFSWIFSWPNHMAFYLVTFAPIILLSIANKKLHWIWGIMLTVLLFGTLSRSGILAFCVEIWILSLIAFIFQKKYRKILMGLFWIWFVGVLVLWWYLFVSGKYHDVILRWASTAWHAQRFTKTLEQIKENPIIWHGIGTAWPSAHYIKSDVIPESWFLQIFYELGILWWFVWFLFIFYAIFLTYNKRKINYKQNLNKINILIVWTVIWIIWLLVQWIVLHSFEDSMISIPLFVLLGILLSLKTQND